MSNATKNLRSIPSLQDEAIARLLLIKPQGRRGSGWLQGRQRKMVKDRFYSSCRKWGYSDDQITSIHWKDVQDMVALEKGAE